MKPNLPVIDIDPAAGFCTGVKRAVKMAEDHLATSDEMLCLGELVHNEVEMERLREAGMKVIDHEGIVPEGKHIFIRAHGEPPETFHEIAENKDFFIDATCPIVLQLQRRVRESSLILLKNGGKVILYGKPGHPEIVGLIGQTSGNVRVISNIEEAKTLDSKETMHFYAQTTADQEKYQQFCEFVKNKALHDAGMIDHLVFNRSICHQVSRRTPAIRDFAASHDIVIFVSGSNSSNGRFLASSSREVNQRTYVVSNADEVGDWFKSTDRIGVSGATSSPLWLLEEVADRIRSKF